MKPDKRIKVSKTIIEKIRREHKPRGLLNHPGNTRELAEKYKLSMSTIRRVAHGTSRR
jgi:Mor family transcriptional regulator